MNESFNLTPYLGFGAEALFLLTIAVFVGFTVSLAYHMFRYSLNRAAVTTWFTVYLVGSAILLVSMLVSLIAL